MFAIVLMLIAPPVVYWLRLKAGSVRLTLYDVAVAVPVGLSPEPVEQPIDCWTRLEPVLVHVVPELVVVMSTPWRLWLQVADSSAPALAADPTSNAAEARTDKN